MKPLAPAALVALLALAFAGGALADEIHLTTGRSVKGTVVKETDKQVVVKTPQGKLTLPRHLIKRIDRQSKGATQLALAREREGQGAVEVAAKLYAKAAEDSDPKVAEAARAGLERLRARRDGAPPPVKPKAGPRPSDPPEPRPRTPAKEEHLKTLPPLSGGPFVQRVLAREVVLALREGNGKKAHRLLDEAQTEFAKDPSYVYLRGRAFEVDGNRRKASKTYLTLLEATKASPRMPVAQLNELCRRRLAGEELTGQSPGANVEWKRVETKNFAIYHRFRSVEDWFINGPENALDYDLEVLKLDRSEVVFSGRIQVFMFEDEEAYEANSGMKLAGGHAQIRYAPDGYLRTITAYAQRGLTLRLFRHEVAHTLLLEVYPRMPAWAHEGAAVYVQKQQSRGFYRLSYLGSRDEGVLPGLETFLRGAVARGADQTAVRRYYAQSSVTFEALAKRQRSPRKALALCTRIGAVGPKAALSEVGLTLRTLDDACLAMAKNKTHDR